MEKNKQSDVNLFIVFRRVEPVITLDPDNLKSLKVKLRQNSGYAKL